MAPAAAEEVLAWARRHLAADPYASGEFADEYQTTSLYFDTEAFDIYHRRGSFRRCKYRIRRYGRDGVVFLERKVRTSATLSKRRTSVGLERLGQLAAERDPAWVGDWFRQRLDVRRLSPTCQIAYRRIARIGMTPDGPMRLTLDREIEVQRARGLEFLPDGGMRVLEKQVVLEMKFCVESPPIFKRLVEEFALVPLPVSKYRLSLEALGRTGDAPDSVRFAPPVNTVDIVDA